MRRFASPIVLILVSANLIFQTSAQAPAPKPAPELKKIAYLVGTWNVVSNTKPGSADSGTKMTSIEENRWMDGGFFLVMHSKYSSTAGTGGSGVGFMGYNTDTGTYTYDEFSSDGEADHAKGTIEGDIWSWSNEEKRNGRIYKGRFTMKIISPSSYTFKYEISPDGTTWTTTLDGTAVRAK